MMGVIRKMVPKYLEDLLCDFNYISHSMDLIDEQLIEVPLFYTKQLIKEFSIYPLGSRLIKSRCPDHIRSILFFGPPGTGKTHAALSVAYHTNSIFIDLSPRNTERFSSKEELTKMVATSFRVAKNNQPAVIYFDFAEQIFVDTKQYKKGAVKNVSAQRLKKLLIGYKNLVTPEMRIIFIGCTNKGWHMNTKDMTLMFDKTLYFALPSFSDRFKIWKNEISKRIGKFYELEYDILAQMSTGYSAESVKNI
jgi:transitional endoplasmic reticulum ATPase